LEEQILRYYLKVSSIFFFIVFLFFLLLLNSSLNKNIKLKYTIIKIEKNENFSNIILNNFEQINALDFIIFKNYYKFLNYFNDTIVHYGNFDINENISIIEFINIIKKPSNILNKITIVDGWSKKRLDLELSKHFESYSLINFNEILADTYYYNNEKTFDDFLIQLKKFKDNYIAQYKSNDFFKKYDENDLLVIGSLIEKEGLDYYDKKLISSVIMNRLQKNMRLQIDASVIYALTNGNYDLNRKLTFKDLKTKNIYNTYINYGLPPSPISYVSTKTIDIIFENYKTDFLFYFYNSLLKRHVFSKNYKNHLHKLNEYRKSK